MSIRHCTHTRVITTEIHTHVRARSHGPIRKVLPPQKRQGRDEEAIVEERREGGTSDDEAPPATVSGILLP